MNGNILGSSGFRETKGGAFLKWKLPNVSREKGGGNCFSVSEFLQQKEKKTEDGVVGPGGGFGLGCGIGLGMGVVGGVGLGGSAVNNLKMVFGIGMGCGIGVGFGFGYGIGCGFSFDSLRSRFFKPEVNTSKKPIFVRM